jgi:hypothetical protein
VLTIKLTFEDGSNEHLRGATQWDLHNDGHLIAWNDEDEVVAEREDVASALPGPLGS